MDLFPEYVPLPSIPSVQELPPEERPREKLRHRGPQSLANSELIAILIGTGTRGTSALELARLLLSEFGSLEGISRACLPQLVKIKGIGTSRALQLLAAFQLGSRLAAENSARQRIDTPEAVYNLLGCEMRSLQRESLRVLLLDTKYQLLRVEEVSLGSLNESIAHPREILRPALIHPSYALLVVHNHPSGDPQPSSADQRFTRRLADAAQLLQIPLLDHIILGSGDNGRTPWFSFKQAGLL